MSQRREIINESINIDLKLKVDIKSFSNHNGFNKEQINRGIEEFKQKIEEHLLNMISCDYQMSEMLYSVDFVDFDVSQADAQRFGDRRNSN